MKITVCPVKNLNNISRSDTSRRAAIISSSQHPEAAYLPDFPYVLRLYQDIDREIPGRSFSNEDAEAVAGFVRSQLDSVDTLYICCDAAESRSPAVAAAIMRYMGLDDMKVWRNPHYHPNMLVFLRLCEALGISVPDSEVDALMYENMKAFRDALGASEDKR